MRRLIATAALLVASASVQAQQSAALQPQQNPEVLKYAVNRKGEQIGTHVFEFRRNGPETSVSFQTKVEVKVLFITAYRFEQSGSERWVNGKFVSMKTTTDDNGTPHKLDVAVKGTGLVVEADGKSTQVDGSVIPASLWNTSLLRQSVALDTQKGNVMKMTIADVGVENVVVQGKPVKAHRYMIKSASTPDPKKTFDQEVWYDDKGNLVQAQFTGSDGSIISYQLL